MPHRLVRLGIHNVNPELKKVSERSERSAFHPMAVTLYFCASCHVNAVSPGPTSTPFHGKLGLSQAELKDAAAREVANVALFLASGDASFMTGSEVVVDGGLTQL